MNYVSGLSGKPSLILAACRTVGRCMNGCKLEVDRTGDRPINLMIGNFLRHGHIACVALVLVVGLTSKAIADGMPDVRTVALTGDPAQGTGPDVHFNTFGRPVLNDAGQTAFRGFVAGTEVDGSNNAGIWSEGGGAGLELIAREGSFAPGMPAGTNFGIFEDPVVNNVGQTAFRGRLIGPAVTSSDERSIWLDGGGTGLELIARQGDAAPGTPADVNFFQFSDPVLNDAGQFAFRAFLSGDGTGLSDTVGIWSGVGSSSLALVARAGNAAPGLGVGVNFAALRLPVLNDAGESAFGSDLTGSGVTFSNDQAVWSQGGGDGLKLIARTDDTAPGTGTGVKFDSFGPSPTNTVLNNAGHVSFYARLKGPDVDGFNKNGLWSADASGVELVARAGSPAPGTGPGVAFFSFAFPLLNGAGQIAFRGNLTGSGVDSLSDSGIWATDSDGLLQLIARKGAAAPGTESGVNFRGFLPPMINGAGQVAFAVSLTGPGVDDENDSGIWATDSDGLLQLIVRKGDLFDVNDDKMIEDLRTISNPSLFTNFGNEDGRRSSFNDFGQMAFKLEFSDGSQGIFISNVVAVAEPDLQPSRSHIDFGEVPPGESSSLEMLFIDNAGDGSLEIGTIITEGPAAADIQIAPSDDQCSLEIVDPDGTCGIGIRFVPQTPGIRTADLRIPSNDPDGPEIIELQGTSDIVFVSGFE